MLREFASTELIRNDFKIGGAEMTVEIDETVITKNVNTIEEQ